MRLLIKWYRELRRCQYLGTHSVEVVLAGTSSAIAGTARKCEKRLRHLRFVFDGYLYVHHGADVVPRGVLQSQVVGHF